MSEFHGTITIDASGELDAEVFLLQPDGKVAATIRVQSAGRYVVAQPPGYTGGWLLAKLYAPVVGARAVKVATATARPIDMAVAADEIVQLQGNIVMPEGVALEWLDVHLTPRSLDGVPAPAINALLAVSTEPVRRSTYVTRRIHEPRLSFAVLPGEYRLEVERVFYDSPSMTNPPTNVRLDSVTVTRGPPAQDAPIGVWLTVRQSMAMTVHMAVVPPDEL